MLISQFSAISSWEGYEYQGHIALYVVLKKIHELIVVNKDTISDFTLEIEGAEDFSIIKSGKYLTLHQVKSGTIELDQSGKKDKFSFIISLLQYDASHGYFHVSPNKNIPDNFIKSTSDWIDILLTDLEKEIKNADEVDEKSLDDFIIINKILPNTKKGSLYNIINFVCGGNKEIENVKSSIEAIKTELLKYKEKIRDNEKLVEDITYMSVYERSFSDSNEVKESSYSIINEILFTLKPEWKLLIDIGYSKFVYGQVLLEIKNQITDIFISKNRADNICRVEFSSILDEILKDYHSEANSKKFQYFLLWDNIQKVYKQFPLRKEGTCQSDLCDTCDNISNCNLFMQIELISKIDEDNMHNFLYRLMLKEPEKGNPHNLPSDNLINRLFINLLKEIDLLSFENNNIIHAQKEGLFYRLTLDSSGEVYELQEQLDKEMRSSTGDSLIIYESDILITDQLNEENFIYNSNNTTIIGDKELKDIEDITSDSIEKMRKNYNKPKVFRLIDRKNAIKELN